MPVTMDIFVDTDNFLFHIKCLVMMWPKSKSEQKYYILEYFLRNNIFVIFCESNIMLFSEPLLCKGLHKYSHKICDTFLDVNMEICVFVKTKTTIAAKL